MLEFCLTRRVLTGSRSKRRRRRRRRQRQRGSPSCETIGENGPDSAEPRESQRGREGAGGGKTRCSAQRTRGLSPESLAGGFPVAGAEEGGGSTQRKREVREGKCRVRRAKAGKEKKGGLVYRTSSVREGGIGNALLHGAHTAEKLEHIALIVPVTSVESESSALSARPPPLPLPPFATWSRRPARWSRRSEKQPFPRSSLAFRGSRLACPIRLSHPSSSQPPSLSSLAISFPFSAVSFLTFALARERMTDNSRSRAA